MDGGEGILEVEVGMNIGPRRTFAGARDGVTKDSLSARQRVLAVSSVSSVFSRIHGEL